MGVYSLRRISMNARKIYLVITILVIVIIIIISIMYVNYNKQVRLSTLSKENTLIDENQMKEDIKILAELQHLDAGNFVHILNNGIDIFTQFKNEFGIVDDTKKIINARIKAKNAKYEKEAFIEIRFLMQVYLYLKQRNFDFEIIAIQIVYKPIGTPVFTKDNEIDEYIRNLDKIYKEIYYEGATDEDLITKMTKKWIEDTGYVRISYK